MRVDLHRTAATVLAPGYFGAKARAVNAGGIRISDTHHMVAQITRVRL
ncbi:hypothetical protein [Azospirillum palustre]